MYGETMRTMRLSFFFALFACVCAFIAESHGETDRGKTLTLYKEALALSAVNSSDKALKAMEQAIQANPGYPEAHEKYGYLLLEKGRTDEAIAAFTGALKGNPRFRSAQAGLGLALVRKGEIEKAEPILKEALILNTDPALAYYALGLVYEKRGEYQKAILHFKEGLRKVKRDWR